MIKFEELVESFLLEQDPVDPEQKSSQAAATTIDPTFSYFTSPKGQSPYDEFVKAFQAVYGKAPLSNTQELQRLITSLEGSSNKNELTISNFTEYTESFPLIDFILYVAQTSLGQTKANIGQFKTQIQNNDVKNKADVAAKGYIQTFKTNAKQNSWPLDYPSLTAQARMLEVGLRKKLADSVVGTLALENQATKSIYQAVLTLLAGREKIRNPLKQVGSSNNFIDQILYGDYKKYAGGGEMVKGKYARMWDQYSVEKLMELGQSIRNFYNYQKALFVPKQETPQQSPISVPTLEQFVKNSVGGKPFSWTASSTYAPQNASFDQSFELLNKQMLQEITDPAIIKKVKAAVGKSAAATKTSKFGASATAQSSQDATQPPNLPDQGYNIKYIMSLTDDSAKDLVNKLKQLGDFITEKEPPEFLKKATNVLSKGASAAEGALFGVKIPGM